MSFATLLVLLTLVLLTIPAATAGGSNGIQWEEKDDLSTVKERKSERRLLKGRVDDRHHHHHGDSKDSSSHAHHDTIHPLSKHRHHHEYVPVEGDNHQYIEGENHNNQDNLIMTVVSDGCGPIGRRQHCPPIEICLIQGIMESSSSPSRHLLSSGISDELQYLDVESHADAREGTRGTGILGTDVLNTEPLVENDEMDMMEVGWDGITVPSGMVGLVPTRRPTPKPSTHIPTGNTPIKRSVSLPSFLPSRIPTAHPTRKPVTRRPSRKPSHTPSSQPTSQPSSRPTSQPTPEPTYEPTLEADPTQSPTVSPSVHPTKSPSTQRPTLPPATSPTTPQINTGNNLINHGGKVMISTQTVAIFWGPKWGISSFVNDKITGIDAFYQGFANSNYAAIVTQYTGSNGPATAHSTYLGHYIDTSSTSGTATPPAHSDIFYEGT